MSGRAYIHIDGEQARDVSLGTVESISETLNKRCMVTPIPSLDMQSAFPIESGNSKSYSIGFKRTNPLEPDDTSGDSDDWPNEIWYNALTNTINRWQVRTDGCTLRYISNGNSYLPDFEEQGYIKSIERTYKADFNEVISGTLTFTVGRMHIRPQLKRSEGTEGTDLKDMFVMISDPEENNWYTIMYGNDPDSSTYNVVDSISISGGPESPFEYATLKLSKRKLMEQIPDLFDDSEEGGKGTLIYATKNKLIMDVLSATGQSRRMFVTKVRVSNDSVTITAYTEAWHYRNYTVESSMVGTPSFIIKQILTDPIYGVSYNLDNIYFSFDEANDKTPMILSSGTSAWRILQDCAMCLGCRIWFADGCAFVVDLRRLIGNDDALHSTYYTDVNLYEMDEKCCVGTVTIDEEGVDPVANSVIVVCSTQDGDGVEVPYLDTDSIEVYGEISAGKVYATEMTQSIGEDPVSEDDGEEVEIPVLENGTLFAQAYVSYLSEPQRSLTFTFKELWYDNGQRIWKPYFGCISQVDRMIDSYDKEIITNESSIHKGKAYHKLAMSSYTRKYPQCTCEYSFGVIANIDLSSSTSQINASLGSR